MTSAARTPQSSFGSWARNNEPIIAVIASLLAILVVGVGLFRFLFNSPDLTVVVSTSALRMPWAMYARMSDAISRDSSKLTDSSHTALNEVAGFLRDTETFTEIVLTNTSKQSLTNVDLRFKYVHDIAGWGIEGDNLDDRERRKLLDSVHYDSSEDLLTLRSVSRFPPKSTLKLFVWGNVASSVLLGSEQITVTYDGGAGELITERNVRGFDAFVYDNSGLLVIILLLVNLSIWAALFPKQPVKSVGIDS